MAAKFGFGADVRVLSPVSGPRKREQAAFAGNATVFLVTVYVAVWLGGAALLSISVVAPRRARSVLAWMRTGKPSATQVNSARPSLRG